MSNHHDDFWGDEATWSSRTAPTERFDDSSHSEFDAASHSTFDAGHTGPVDTEHTGPLDIVRKRWNRLLGSGSNATREHGIVRPSTVPNDIDATTTFGSPDEPASVWIDDEPTPLWNATMFDDIDHDADHGSGLDIHAADEQTYGVHAALTTGADHGLDEQVGLDPMVARLGALAVIATLLIPLMVGFGSDDDGGAVQTVAESSTSPAAQAALVPAADSTDVPVTDHDVIATVPAAIPATNSTAQVVEVQPDTTSPADAEGVDTVRGGTFAPLESNAVAVDQVDAAAEVDDDSSADRLVQTCAIDYEVVAGDFWIRIADGAGVELSELLEANGASTTTSLFPGGSICLPAGASIPAPPTTTPATTPATTGAPVTTAAPTTAAPTTEATTTTTAATTTTTTDAPATLPPNANASAEEVKQIIRDVWPDELEERAIEIAFRESRFAPTAKNFCCHGVFQIYFSVHQSWLSDLGINSINDLYDPAANTRAAYTLYQRAGGWGPWGF